MSEEHIGRMKEPEIVWLSQKPISLIPKAFWWVSIPIFLYAFYSVTNGYIEKYRTEAEKIAATEKAREMRGNSTVRHQEEFWVTADSPSCFKSPRGDIFIGIVGEGRNLKRIGPDGTVTHIGRNKTETSPNLKEGDMVCFQLEDSGKPAKMRVVAM